MQARLESLFSSAVIVAFALFASPFALAVEAAPGGGPSQQEMVDILRRLDEQQRNSGDYKWTGVIYQKERGKADVAYEAVVYRRDEEDKLMILFTAPKTEAGKGYLRIDENLFRYDPTVGKWERTTERERILGTDTRRADFDESRLAEEYTPSWVGEEALGRFTTQHLKLQAKPGADVAYPVVDVWVDKATGNPLKYESRAASGRLLRTVYLPSWTRMYSESKGDHVYVPREIRVYDELEKGNSTIVTLQDVDLSPLPANIFTKAWLESQSR